MKVKLKNLATFITENRVVVSVGMLLFIFAFFLRIWRLSEAPDIHGDEVTYNVIANNLLTRGQLTYNTVVWFTHPPLYFLFLAGYRSLSSQTSLTLNSVYIARTLSGILAAVMIVVVYLFIAKIQDFKSAAMVSVLLAVDPYLTKFSRIGMLESMALMFIALTFYLFYKAETSGAIKQYLLAGISLGLVLLTKEFAGYIILGLIIYMVFTRLFKIKTSPRGLAAFLGVAAIMYLVYITWSCSIDANAFFAAKNFLIKRITGVVIDTGYLKVRYISLYTDILETFWLYGTSHILVLLSVPSSIYLLIKRRSRETALLASWLYISFIFIGAIRIYNAQFYCYLVVPAVIINGLALWIIIKPRHPIRIDFNKRLLLGLIFLVLLVSYNGYVWTSMYGVGTDTAFRHTIDYVQANLPKETKIQASSAYRHFLPGYQVYEWGAYPSVASIEGEHIQYFIFSPREYHYISEDLLDYILTNGRLVESFEGHSLRHIDIYYIDKPV